MDDAELSSLLANLESDRVERKASASDREEIRKAICAFANDMPGHARPGVLFIGVRDDGSCAGLPVTDELLRKLSDIRDEGHIQPLPAIRVQKRILHGCELAVVEVEPDASPPVRVRGKVWIRVGPRKAEAGPEEERRLSERRRASDLPFDIQPLPSAGLADLDPDLQREYVRQAIAPDVLEANERPIEQQLRSLRMIDGGLRPTVCGMLVLGKDPRRFLPGAYVQFARFEGRELSDEVRDRKEIAGPLPELLRRLDEILEAHTEVRTRIVGAAREERWSDYPLEALKQIARNALLHRTYEGTNAPSRVYWFGDRVEVHSPGGPYGLVTVANFGQDVTDYRNPHLAEAMQVLGYVQRFGVGIPIARRELERNGNPPLELRATPSNVLVILRSRD